MGAWGEVVAGLAAAIGGGEDGQASGTAGVCVGRAAALALAGSAGAWDASAAGATEPRVPVEFELVWELHAAVAVTAASVTSARMP